MVEQSRVGLLDPEDEGVMVLKNIRIFPPVTQVSIPTD
jgi:hypothetical protein